MDLTINYYWLAVWLTGWMIVLWSAIHSVPSLSYCLKPLSWRSAGSGLITTTLILLAGLGLLYLGRAISLVITLLTG